jgi:ABC-type Mn2+/Zn2+ transport system permease subunit
VVAVQTVGVVLVLALPVTPAARASLVSRTLGVIMALSVTFAVLATIIGFCVSYHLDLSSGPAIVLALTLVFGLSWLTSKARRSAVNRTQMVSQTVDP